MAVEYRPARADELHEYIYSGRIGFGESTADAEIWRRIERWPDELSLDWTLCAFEDGVLASKMFTQPLTIGWNGRAIACGAVGAVTTLPTHRRRGHLRELMRRSLALMRDNGQPVGMLWASMAAIYQRFGFGLGYTETRALVEPRHLRFVEEIPASGRVRLLPHTRAAAMLMPLYERFAASRSLMLHRGTGWWQGVLLRPWAAENAPPPLVAVYEEDGQTAGYVIYDVQQHHEWQPGPDQQLNVSEFVWLSPAAHRALIRYLSGYDLARSIRFSHLPADDPLFVQLEEPRLLGLTAHDGTLLRIVDLVAALEGRAYDRDGRFSFGLADALCPWNSGAWELSVEGGRARLKRIDAEPELQLTPRALAMIATGHHSATLLARAGLMPAADAALLSRFDDLFRTCFAPFCFDEF